MIHRPTSRPPARADLPSLLHHPILGLSPLEQPDGRLAVALARAGALSILDLGRRSGPARKALALLAREAPDGFGVRVPERSEWAPADLPPEVQVVVLQAGAAVSRFSPRRVLVQITSEEEALAAAEAGADGLIVKGHEAGGRVGSETTFVLLQRVAAATSLPLWAQGGIGLHTAAAALACGARGVVLDSQLALVRESSLPEPIKAAIRGMDGSETALLGEHRVFTRPDLPVARKKAPAPQDLGAFLAHLGGQDLERDLLPLGQDAAFARPLAERYRTAGGLVHAMRAAMDEHLEEARTLSPLGPGSPLAQDHGIRYPIAQGPMTRVSDRAAFADAVSKGGGLPFLALALMRGDEVRALLVETAALLGDRAFGVGILGFVPEDLRQEQIAAVQEIRPKAAIIAGGRPSQARPLDAQGTITYLHVPSPGLLDLFLNDGARRFVFEGRECGGHVGPRTSFVLWELQIERLLAFADARGAEGLTGVSVLFAGGVHDARSAAMVSAMAAPLAARGAHIGVLMGTAYLFTEEAVATGAILPAFQEAALECERTVLLETAPGHATRCTDNDYAHSFQEERARLEAEGKSAEEVWAALEQLNLGRLRLAAKGLRREGPSLVKVDHPTQAREGMFMIGQVAALRSAILTIEALHEDVSAGSIAALARSAPPEERAGEKPRPADIAIIGIACIFPDAVDRHAYWANICAGKSAVTEVPKERWDAAIYYDPEAPAGEKSASRWGGFLPTIAFDPLLYGIPPRSLSSIEPVQLLALDVARRALEDAGYGERSFDRERTAVIFGAEAGTDLSSAYGFRALVPQYAGPLPPALDEHLPTLTEDSFPGVLANVIAGRIANRLDLGGSNYTVDAACASSLAAVDLAVKELTAGSADLVLCGGADLHNSINDYLLFSSVHALSPTGACRTFDASADGIVLGEGVACVVLKRLADAERDGDRIYAVIKGIAGSSDGRSLGLTAPRKEGQIRALERAYRASGVSPAEVGLVEAHGTGTVVGDRTELGTLTDVYLGAGTAPGAAALGSVKSQIGHTKCAAGLAGMIKTALALHHRALPPTLQIRKPNPGWDPASSPFHFSDHARPWPGEERRASVSAFGFGGANFHAVLSAYEGADPPASGLERWPVELFLFRAPDRAAAAARIEQIERLLTDEVIEAAQRGAGLFTLADLARSVSERRRRADGPVQIAVLAESLADLRDKLKRARAFTADGRSIFVAGAAGEASPGKVAFLFPGQGSQRTGMLGDLFLAFPPLQRFLSLGSRWVSRMFPPMAPTPEIRAAQVAALTDTRVAQPALGVTSLALGSLLRSLGLKPDMVAGHSYGELAALCFAGAIDEADLLALSEQRAACILTSTGDDPGTMAAVTAPPSAVEPVIEGIEQVVIANHNAPEQTVISGPTSGIAEAIAALEAEGLSARSIPVACAFHSPLVARAPALFAEHLARIDVRSPHVPVYSNATAATYPADARAIRNMLADHLGLSVRFTEEIEAMYAAGARTFVEVGPGRVLSGLVGKILAGKPHLAVACDQSGEPGLARLLAALAELAVGGVAVDAAALFAGRAARLLDLAAISTAPRSSSLWLVNGHLARPAVGEIPKGALRPVEGPLVNVSAAPPPPDDRKDAVIEFLRASREIVEAQRQVMLGFLGQAPEVIEVAGVPQNVPALGTGPSTRRVTLPPASSQSSSWPPPSRAPRSEAELPLRVRGPVPSIPAPMPSLTPPSLKDTLLGIVGERTGYPVEMLDLDLNLEADLSIDSIKRIEILGTLGQMMGWAPGSGDGRDKMIEKLATQKTLRGILTWLEANPGGKPAAEPAKADPPRAEPASPARTSRLALHRFLLSVEDAPARPVAEIGRRRWAIVPDRAGVAEALGDLLAARGATARVIGSGEPLGEADGLVDLSALAAITTEEVTASTRGLFERLKRAGEAGLTVVIAAVPLGAPFGPEGALPRAGVAGLIKTAARELPLLCARAVALDPAEGAAQQAEHLLDELRIRDAHLEVARVGGARKVLIPISADRIRNGADGTGMLLGPESVVLVTGGARGITASTAVAIGKRFGCRLELVGRTPLPDEDEDPDLAALRDLPALRKGILARGLATTPAAVESLCAKITAARALRSTLAEIAKTGATARYHAVDVRDRAAFGALIDAIYAHHGRIDGVIHGAGVLEDRLIAQKTRESFDRVFDTKVESALTLVEKIRPDLGFFVFFGSVSGAFGNKGQIDYAAANDTLDKLAYWLKERVKGRVVSLDWGPWAGAGMVSPELAREYERRGVGLIDPQQGVDAFLDELLHGGAASQVILMSGSPEVMIWQPAAEAPPVTAPSPIVIDA
ncbi:MAG: SDR family NAD(P)-dependent oxidoreductase [Byssovorax sp.]